MWFKSFCLIQNFFKTLPKLPKSNTDSATFVLDIWIFAFTVPALYILSIYSSNRDQKSHISKHYFFFFFFFLIVSYIKVSKSQRMLWCRAVLLCIHAPSLFLWGPCFLVLVSFVVAAFAVNVLWYGHTGCVSTIHNLKLCRDIINFEANWTGCIGINCVKRCCEAL